MKKTIYLLTIIFSLALVSSSCEKEPADDPKTLTLEQAYPEWKNLTWVSTDGASLTTTYPRISIKIVGDSITMIQLLKFPQLDRLTQYNGFYDMMTITGNTVKFSQKNNWGEAVGTFSKTNTHITLTTYGNVTESHVYVLKIN